MSNTIKENKQKILASKGLCLKKSIMYRYPDEYEKVENMIGSSWAEKLYNYIFDCPDHKCPVCGKPTKFISIIKGYSQYCSIKCSKNDPKIIEKTRQTNIERYGVDNPSKSKEVQEKIKRTNIERYGVDNPMKNDKIKQRLISDMIDKYGGVGWSSDEIRKKAKTTNIERYGVNNPFESKEIQEKIKQTNIERYGVDNPTKSKEIRKKVHQTYLDRYGGFTLQSPILKEKVIRTNLERYGVPMASMIKSAREKMIANVHKNNIERIDDLIGYMKNGDWICKCPHPETCDQCREKYYIIPKNHQPSIFHNRRKRDNVELCTRLLPIRPIFSTYELQVRSWLKNELKVKYISNDRSIISPLELDIYIPENHLAIEINGCYWHSNDYKPKSYHMDKWSQCKEKGIKMITLWEDWIRDHPADCLQLLKYHLGIINERPHFDWIDNNLVDLGLGSGSIKGHLSIHNGFECWDTGLFM